MPEFRIEFLPSAWQDLNKIADLHLQLVGAESAEQITDEILDAIDGLSRFPYMGALHPDPVLARMEYRKLVCRKYVAVYRVMESTVYLYRIVNGITDYPKLLY